MLSCVSCRQSSHTPKKQKSLKSFDFRLFLVEISGIEPLTS